MAGDRELTLGDCVSLVRGITYQSSRLGEPGPVLLGLASIGAEGGFRGDNLKSYGGSSPENLLLRPGDLYVSLKDVTQAGRLLGSVAKVPSHVAVGRLTQDTVKLQLKPESPPAEYLYWLLRTPEYREYCKERAIGTTNLALSRLDFLAFSVPPLTEIRVHLCELLSAIENKIDLNRHTAMTLEAVVRALFKSWFVDFDPVHAKAEGRPTNLPEAVAALFPNDFGEKGIPVGWNMKPISDIFDVSGGNTPKTDNPEFWDGQHQWATPKDLSGLPFPILLQTGRQLTDSGLKQTSSALLPPGSLLLSTRAPIGYMAFTSKPTAINQGFAGFVRKNISPAYAWSWCQAHLDVIMSSAGGSTFPEISKAVLRQIPMLLPSPPVLDAFSEIADSVVQRIAALARESQTLISTRNIVLPKLICNDMPSFGSETQAAVA
ncbi:restriction endonuclease subunit S [Roseomonas mucosa]|uniref:restriction endonuclease subunit S n=1 Tax=Roseomonas mucosa TaxID=207340 RepID=UPI001EF451D4|nr:restriction endonuclease subunit S [Roseomonas mucosa]MCG7354111.1 restriction endonuclease subunit S [Roseomonas mucosa]